MPPTPVVLIAVVVLVLISMASAWGLGTIRLTRGLAVVVVVAAIVAPAGYLSAQYAVPEEADHGPDPARGQAVFLRNGTCFSCHTIAGISNGTIGPDLTHIATVGETRRPGLAAEAYIRESMKDPNAFIAPGFVADMPLGLANGRDFEDVVAFLLTKK